MPRLLQLDPFTRCDAEAVKLGTERPVVAPKRSELLVGPRTVGAGGLLRGPPLLHGRPEVFRQNLGEVVVAVELSLVVDSDEGR